MRLPAEVLLSSAALLSTSNLCLCHSRKKKEQREKESGGIASEGHLQRLWHRLTVLDVYQVVWDYLRQSCRKQTLKTES